MCQEKIYKLLKKKGELKQDELKRLMKGQCNRSALWKGLNQMKKYNEIKIKDGKVKLNI